MLAMLSCIFWEPEEKEAISTADLHLAESVCDIPGKLHVLSSLVLGLTAVNEKSGFFSRLLPFL